MSLQREGDKEGLRSPLRKRSRRPDDDQEGGWIFPLSVDGTDAPGGGTEREKGRINLASHSLSPHRTSYPL